MLYKFRKEGISQREGVFNGQLLLYCIVMNMKLDHETGTGIRIQRWLEITKEARYETYSSRF